MRACDFLDAGSVIKPLSVDDAAGLDGDIGSTHLSNNHRTATTNWSEPSRHNSYFAMSPPNGSKKTAWLSSEENDLAVE